MLIASFEYSDKNRKIFFFRGKDVSFWTKEIFANLKFFKLNNIKDSFNFLILFDPTRFLKIGSETVDEIINFFENTKLDKNRIFSIIGNPFFIISDFLYKDLKFNSYKKLKNRKNISYFTLKGDYEVLDPNKYAKKIEDFILDFQTKNLIHNGVIIDDYNNFFIEGIIPIGKGTRISSGTVIRGKTIIGENVEIYPNSYIENSVIKNNCTVLPGCVIRDSKIEHNVQIGPYTHLRSGSIIKKNAKIGNFVEMKKSVLGEGSKSMHLSYIGDTEVGKNVNIGAGTITCNYDGIKKNPTIIEDNVFIGSGTELVAPLVVGKNSYVGAGSTINQNVPKNSLAIAREKQRNIKGWVERKRKKK